MEQLKLFDDKPYFVCTHEDMICTTVLGEPGLYCWCFECGFEEKV